MKKVGIAGCGGIGSNVAVHLVRSGVTRLRVADFDRVAVSNLNRQFYFADQAGMVKTDALETNLKRINPAVEIEKFNVKLTENNIRETFEGCGVIVEGFDRADCKKMLLEAFACTDKTVVSACGLAGLDLGRIREKRVSDNAVIFGDFETDISEKKLYSPKIFIVASMMANAVLKELGFKDDL